jgi:hypothetical protein
MMGASAAHILADGANFYKLKGYHDFAIEPEILVRLNQTHAQGDRCATF